MMMVISLHENMSMTGDKRTTQGGFAIFYTMITMGILLIIMFLISNLVLNQIQFSITLKSSQEALFAANSGLECALYHDIYFAKFKTGIQEVDDAVSNRNFTCAGQSFTSSNVSEVADTTTYKSRFEFDVSGQTCVTVEVFKVRSGNTPQGTLIQSFGQDGCGAGAGQKTERAIRVFYGDIRNVNTDL